MLFKNAIVGSAIDVPSNLYFLESEDGQILQAEDGQSFETEEAP